MGCACYCLVGIRQVHKYKNVSALVIQKWKGPYLGLGWVVEEGKRKNRVKKKKRASVEKVAFELSLGRWMGFLQTVGVGYWEDIAASLGKERTGTKAFMVSLKDPFMNHGGITYTKYFKDAELCNHEVVSVNEKSFPWWTWSKLFLISLKYRHMLVTGEKVCWNKIVNIQIPLYYSPAPSPHSFT